MGGSGNLNRGSSWDKFLACPPVAAVGDELGYGVGLVIERERVDAPYPPPFASLPPSKAVDEKLSTWFVMLPDG